MGTTEYIVDRSMRDITGNAIAVAASPHVTSAPGSNIYPLVAQQNKIIDTDYLGEANIMGNIPVSMLNSPESAYLDEFDVAHFPMAINYRYMAIKANAVNKALNVQVVHAMEEAMAHAYAETFTELSFFQSTYHAGALGVPPLDDDNEIAGQLGMFMMYQTILQNIVQLDAKYKQLMSLEETLTHQAWLREVPQIRQMFGLLKKKALVSYMDGLGTLVPGNALDAEWAKQVNVLCNVPCKKSDSYNDPLVVIDAYHAMPDYLEVKSKPTPGAESELIWFYSSELDPDDAKVPVKDGKRSRYWAEYTIREWINNSWRDVAYCDPLENLFYGASCYLSPYTVIKIARDIYTGKKPASYVKEYYNTVIAILESIVNTLGTFSSDFAEMNVVLKVMQRVGLNNWEFGNACASNDHIANNYHPVYNKLLYDVFSAMLAGGDQMVWDDNSKRWKFWTIWSLDKDIPAYDVASGGAFLTFSTREIPTTVGYGDMLRYCVPILFNSVQPHQIEFMNRRGEVYSLSSRSKTSAQLEDMDVIARIQAVIQPDLTIKIPCFNHKEGGSKVTEAFLMKAVTSICGMCAMLNTAGTTTNWVLLDTNVMNLLDVQMEDISNVMINQAREHAPFRVAAAGSSSVGFLKVVS